MIGRLLEIAKYIILIPLIIVAGEFKNALGELKECFTYIIYGDNR